VSRVRVGILGTGTVVRDFHLPVLLANPRAQVVAIGNLHAPSLERLADEHRIAKRFTDFDRLAADPEIDAVVIALPNYLHAPVTRQMLQAGKHVLCEKPMAVTAEEAQSMVAAAEAAGRKLMVAHVWRFHPQVQWLRSLIDSGQLGQVTRIRAHAIVVGRGPKFGSWFQYRRTAGGGALADVGIHSIDTISFLFHDCIKPVNISAQTANRFQKLEVEDSASVRIAYDNGMVAWIEAGWYHEQAASPHGAIEVFGSKGEARTLPARWRAGVGRPWQEFERSDSAEHPDDNRSVYAAQMDHFLDCILDDRQPACDSRQGLCNAIVLEAAYEAARSGSTVDVSSHSWEPAK